MESDANESNIGARLYGIESSLIEAFPVLANTRIHNKLQ